MRGFGVALSGLFVLGIALLVASPGWAIWHFPSAPPKGAPGPGDIIPLALAVGGVATVQAALSRGLVQGSAKGWSRAYFLAASSIAIMIVVGEYLVPASATGLGRTVWIAVVNFVVQVVVLRWAIGAMPAGFFRVGAQANLATMGRVLLIPSILPAFFHLLLPGLYR